MWQQAAAQHLVSVIKNSLTQCIPTYKFLLSHVCIVYTSAVTCYLVLLDSLSKMWPLSIKPVHHTGFWWENLIERHHLEELGIGEKKYKNGSSGSWWGGMTGLFWPRIGRGGGGS